MSGLRQVLLRPIVSAGRAASAPRAVSRSPKLSLGFSLAPALLAFCLCVVGLLAACERDPESTRALLKQQQQQWLRDMSAMRRQEGDLRARLARLSTARRAAAWAEAPAAEQLRVEPLLNGTHQSLASVELQAQQVPARMEPVLRQGGEAAVRALDAERARITEYMRRMREQLDTADRELAALEHG